MTMFPRPGRGALPLLALPLLALSACAGDVRGYPSLEPRPIEKAIAEGTPVPSTSPTVAAMPAMAADLTQIAAAADAASADFDARLAAERETIAKGRGAAAGSENWVAAQEAYSAVDSARGPIGSALADLDRLRQEAVAKGDAEREQTIVALALRLQALDDAARAKLTAIQPAG